MKLRPRTYRGGIFSSFGGAKSAEGRLRRPKEDTLLVEYI